MKRTALKVPLALLLFFLVPLSVDAQTAWARWPGYSITVPGLAANGSAVTLTVPLLLPDGSPASPGAAFANDTNTGFYRVAADEFAAVTNGAAFFGWHSGGIRMNATTSLGWTSNASLGAPDTYIYRGAANTLYQKNGANAQSFWIANTDDGAGNYERGGLQWSGNYLELFTTKGGTGSSRNVRIVTAGGSVFTDTLRPVSSANTLGVSGGSWAGAFLDTYIQGSKSKALTDAAAAASFVRIAVPTGGSVGGDVIYTATSTNGTAALTRQARWSFAGADTAGTVTCGVGTEYGVATAYSRANTLVCTMTAVTSTTNCDLQVTCTDNLAAAQTMSFNWRLDMPLTATVTPQ